MVFNISGSLKKTYVGICKKCAPLSRISTVHIHSMVSEILKYQNVQLKTRLAKSMHGRYEYWESLSKLVNMGTGPR
jgi:hypothetical protein